jgi:hypothetical protein
MGRRVDIFTSRLPLNRVPDSELGDFSETDELGIYRARRNYSEIAAIALREDREEGLDYLRPPSARYWE